LLVLLKKSYIDDLFSLGSGDGNDTFRISSIIFWIICVLLALGSYVKDWSLIPLMGLVSCLYLLTGMTGMNWAWFGSWLLLGLVVYRFYGFRKSKLALPS
jgi:hypothetical protein